jgi:hypothetical protein
VFLPVRPPARPRSFVYVRLRAQFVYEEDGQTYWGLANLSSQDLMSRLGTAFSQEQILYFKVLVRPCACSACSTR